jgi:HK97 family phage portal protein
MNVLQRMVSGVAQAVGLQAGLSPTGDRGWSNTAIGVATTAGLYVDDTSGAKHWAVRASQEALAGPISTLPFMVFERLEGDKRRPAREHPLFKVLHSRPNRRQTAQEFRDEQQRHLAWWRNAYAIIRPAGDGYPVGELETVHPSRVWRVERGTDGWVYYWINRLAPATGYDVFREDDILHLRKAPLTRDGLRGVPVWESDGETIGKALAVEQFGALYFANGGAGGGVLEHPGNFRSKEDEQSFLDAWRAGGTGSNRHKDRLLKFGVKYSRNTVQNDEAQFLETKKQAGYEVASIWNMPPHRVGMLERATNNNIEQQSIEFVVYTLAPWISAWEQGATRDLLIGQDQDRFFIEFNVAGLLRGDLKTRWAAYATGRQWGWLSVNDILRLENMNPIGEQGDVYLQPSNMQDAKSVAGTLSDPNAKDNANA